MNRTGQGSHLFPFLPFLLFLVFGGVFFLFPALLQAEGTGLGKSGTTDQGQRYDVVVVGGDPEGISAAIGAARAGVRTLLIDTRPVLGGLFTRGWLNVLDINRGPDRRLLNGGVFREWLRLVEGEAFSIDTAERAFVKLVRGEPNLTLLSGVGAVEPLVDDVPARLVQPGQSVISSAAAELYFEKVGVNTPPRPGEPNSSAVWGRAPPESNEHPQGASSFPRVTGVRVWGLGAPPMEIKAQVCVDATQDGDLCAAAGVEFSRGWEDFGGSPLGMGITLVFRLDGVGESGWGKLVDSLRRGRFRGRAWEYQGAVCGFGDVMRGYRPSQPGLGVRALNIGRQRDGSILINALHLFGIDGLDSGQREKGRAVAERELPFLAEFLRNEIPGFGGSRLGGSAPELYVRETRHIRCRYTLSIDDVLENRDFPDGIAFGSYPLDVQATSPDFKGDILGRPVRYGIPLRCLIPRKIEGLLVCGRAAGFSSLAATSSRVVPVGMATGQAAGAAAALLVLKGRRSVSEVEADECRKELERQGVELRLPPVPVSREAGHWAYEGLKHFRSRGLVSGGYENRFSLDEEISGPAFFNALRGIVPGIPKGVRQELFEFSRKLRVVSLDQALCMVSRTLEGPSDVADVLKWARERGYLNPGIQERVRDHNGTLTRGCSYMLLKRVSEKRDSR